jgi:hypothetical protein
VRNLRTRETDALLAETGLDAPHIALFKIGHDEKHGTPLRVTALAHAAPFFASKPAPTPPPRFITDNPELGELTDAKSAASFTAKVVEQVRAGKMELNDGRFFLAAAEMFVRLHEQVSLETEVERHRELTQAAAE